jgi:hypothetical protein
MVFEKKRPPPPLTTSFTPSECMYSIDFNCRDYSSETEALAALNSDVSFECESSDISDALASTWFDVTSELISLCRDNNVDVSTPFYSSANHIRSQIKELTNLLRIKKGEKRIIAPAFEWTQSGDAVFLNVKLSHKIDTPATLGCVLTPESVTMTKESLTLTAPCPIQHKTFELKLDLFGYSLLDYISPLLMMHIY